MKVFAAILAAGRGDRFGSDKVEELLGGRPLWRWSLDTYLSHPEIDSVILVTSKNKVESIRLGIDSRVTVISGGTSRQTSSRLAVETALEADIVLIHDAARPFVTTDLISRTIEAIKRSGAAASAVPVHDTIREIESGSVRLVDRSKLIAMQTPQGAQRSLLDSAHKMAESEFTDDMALLEAIGVHPEFVDGEINNFKITTTEDLVRARSFVGPPETRTGIGYDIHAFSDDPTRTLYLGGVHFPGHPALEGHSDADVLLHAACDALLGAASLGDIGQHFQNTDPRWAGCASTIFLEQVGAMLRENRWRVVNLDMTLIAESPKVMKHAEEIRCSIANRLSITSSRISVKATTNERLGSIGRGEGIAAIAVATIIQDYLSH